MPVANPSHVLLSFKSNRFASLIDAVRASNIIPTAVPANGGWISVDQDIARLGLTLRARVRIEFGQLGIDAQDINGIQEVRLGVKISSVNLELDVLASSSSVLLATLSFAMSGRVAIGGRLEARPASKGIFFVLTRVLAELDDTTVGLPPPWPVIDLEDIINRITDREIRARLGVGDSLPERQLPISTTIETGGLLNLPLQLGYVLREPAVHDDWLTHVKCLPRGVGSPACSEVPGASATFFERIEVYATRDATSTPAPAMLANRDFQIDIGIDLLRAAIASMRTSAWEGETKFGPFCFSYKLDVDIRPWRGDPSQAGFWFSLTGKEYIWYPKSTKWCKGWTDTPFGRWEFDYPCGIEEGWWIVQTVRIEVAFRLVLRGSQVILERDDIYYETDTNWWAALYKWLFEYLVGLIPYIGPVLAAAMQVVDTVVFIANIIARVLAEVIDEVAPNQFELTQGFARLPLINDRVQLVANNQILSIDMSGMTLAFDGSFQRS